MGGSERREGGVFHKSLSPAVKQIVSEGGSGEEKVKDLSLCCFSMVPQTFEYREPES